MDRKLKYFIICLFLLSIMLVCFSLGILFETMGSTSQTEETEEIEKVRVEIEKLVVLDGQIIEQNDKLILENEKLNNKIDKLNEELYLASFEEREIELLCRVAASEAGPAHQQSQKNVVYVILNRVNDERFPNTIEEVVKQPQQFAVIPTKAYMKVDITDELVANINEALLEYNNGERLDGALYFAKGFNNGKHFIMKDEVGHIFSK